MKKFLSPTLLIAAVALLYLSAVHAEVREWTQSATGNKIKAEFVKMKDEKTVTLRMAGGRTHDIPIASLSEGDQTYIKEKSADAPKEMEKKADSAEKGKDAELPKGEVTVVLSDVHLCCSGCVKEIDKIKAVEKFRIDEEVEIKADRGDKTITIEAPSGKDAQRVLNAILTTGYYGKSDHDLIQMKDPRGKGEDFKSNIMTVKGVHMCCGSCVKAAKAAVKEVEGVEENTIKEGGTQFYVKGKEFKPYDVMMALRAAGFGGVMQ